MVQNDGRTTGSEAGLAVFFRWKVVSSGSVTTDVRRLRFAVLSAYG